MSYRFRLEGELLVLQVGTYTKSRYDYEGQTTWRDATVGDIPVRDPFARDQEAAAVSLGNNFHGWLGGQVGE